MLLPVLMNCASLTGSTLHTAYNDEIFENEKLIRSGRYRQAVDELGMLLELDPKNERVLFLRGVANQHLEEYSLAVQDYQGVLALNAKSSPAYYNLGMIYAFILNDRDHAQENFKRFLELSPLHPESFGVRKILAAL